ncbi:hypothetical protein J6590_002967 [Homalodisca vitripennis]|nr:hypothetical protein J6590_002967 [Homalodisca vitripennis]
MVPSVISQKKILSGREVRTKKPSLTLNLRTTTNGRAGGLLARGRSLSGHPFKQQQRSTLLDPTTLRH